MTTEEILKTHDVLHSLDADQISSLINQLGHLRAANRNAAFERAKRLTYPSLSKLLKDLAGSDDPELVETARRLSSIKRTMTGIEMKAVEVMTKALGGDIRAQGALATLFCRGEWGLLKNPGEALRWAKASSDQSHPIGLYALATIHMTPYLAQKAGVEADNALATSLYKQCLPAMRKLSVKGDPIAQCSLGRMLETGHGTARNAQEALKWYEASAKQGLARAQYSLGAMYATDALGSPDIQTALEWWLLSSQQGNARAQERLGHAYAMGKGVARDYDRAIELYRLAVSQEDAQAQVHLGRMYASGHGVTRNERAAASLYQLAAEQGDVNGQKATALTYDRGIGVPLDKKKALHWYERAAEQDDIDSQIVVGMAYDIGIGIAVNTNHAFQWMSRAAGMNSPVAQHYLGNMYSRGRGIQKNNEQALEMWRKAAAQDHSPSYMNLGHAYAYGWGVDTNAAEAIKWYSKAIDKGNIDAAWALAVVYSQPGTKATDYALAIKWFTKAADKDIALACNALAWLHATCPDHRFHDGRKAIIYALKACELEPESSAYVDTLAAAYARDKQYARAAAIQREASSLLQKGDDEIEKRESEGFKKRLRLYEASKPYTEDNAPSAR